METKISLSQLRDAVYKAYEEYKSMNEGEVDPRLTGVDADKFGISLALADGTIINKGDTNIASAMGAMVKIPMSTILFTQNTFQELIKKSGKCPMHQGIKKEKIDVRGKHGIRAMSAIEPVGDPDSKWNFVENRMIDLMGSAPTLDINLYEKRKADIASDIDKLAEGGYYLYDDAAQSIDLYRRAQSMTATAEQLAIMGATIANAGINPLTRKIVFDAAITPRVVAMMAAKGPHKMALPWNVAAGIPARSGFGGGIVAVYPGVFAIAAYSPRLMPNNVSMKGVKAIIDIANSLGINLYSGSCLTIDKER